MSKSSWLILANSIALPSWNNIAFETLFNLGSNTLNIFSYSLVSVPSCMKFRLFCLNVLLSSIPPCPAALITARIAALTPTSVLINCCLNPASIASAFLAVSNAVSNLVFSTINV